MTTERFFVSAQPLHFVLEGKCTTYIVWARRPSFITSLLGAWRPPFAERSKRNGPEVVEPNE